jgi:hypothetical protein
VHQFFVLDEETLISFIPYSIGGRPVTMESILGWKGEEWSCLVLPHTASIACYEFHINNSDVSSDEISSNDPNIQNAIRLFNAYLLMITPFLPNRSTIWSLVGRQRRDCAKPS